MTRLPLRLSEAVAVVVALVIGYVVTDHVAVIRTDDKPFVRSGSAKDTVHLSYADVRLLDVRTSKYLGVDPSQAGHGVHLVKPAGVFVLVSVELTATRQNTLFPADWLVDTRGRRFQASRKATCADGPMALTGRPTYALFCFDVPADLLADLHLQVGRSGDENDFFSGYGDDLADLDLGISPATAATLAAPTATYAAVQSSPTPFTLQTVTVQDGGG